LDIVAEFKQSPIGCSPNSGLTPITMTGGDGKATSGNSK